MFIFVLNNVNTMRIDIAKKQLHAINRSFNCNIATRLKKKMKTLFQISPNEYQVRLFLNQELDFESRSAYVISLEASDASAKPLKAFASVAVAVWDVQDQPPSFTNAPYSATVPENTPEVHKIIPHFERKLIWWFYSKVLWLKMIYFTEYKYYGNNCKRWRYSQPTTSFINLRR